MNWHRQGHQQRRRRLGDGMCADVRPAMRLTSAWASNLPVHPCLYSCWSRGAGLRASSGAVPVKIRLAVALCMFEGRHTSMSACCSAFRRSPSSTSCGKWWTPSTTRRRWGRSFFPRHQRSAPGKRRSGRSVHVCLYHRCCTLVEHRMWSPMHFYYCGKGISGIFPCIPSLSNMEANVLWSPRTTLTE